HRDRERYRLPAFCDQPARIRPILACWLRADGGVGAIRLSAGAANLLLLPRALTDGIAAATIQPVRLAPPLQGGAFHVRECTQKYLAPLLKLVMSPGLNWVRCRQTSFAWNAVRRMR